MLTNTDLFDKAFTVAAYGWLAGVVTVILAASGAEYVGKMIPCPMR